MEKGIHHPKVPPPNTRRQVSLTRQLSMRRYCQYYPIEHPSTVYGYHAGKRLVHPLLARAARLDLIDARKRDSIHITCHSLVDTDRN